MAHITVADQEQRTQIRRSVLASMAGGVLEWYDFILYGNAAALIFGQLFFPKFSPLAGTLAAFATYAVGFFAPLSGALSLATWVISLGASPFFFSPSC